MVFNLSSKKKKNSKIPKRNSKLRIQTNSQRNVTVTNNVILAAEQPQNFADPSIFNNISSSRAIFESRKLESACSFLKCLKQKLEKDVKESNEKLLDNSTSETITDILDTLIDVSDSITPMMSDVSTKCIQQNTSSGSSSVSEQHFNKTMAATNKLLQLTRKSPISSNMMDATYYFAHKIIANNVEELTIFKDNIHHVGDKIFVDKKLLNQLVELHSLLRDTIDKLKFQEQQFTSETSLNKTRDTNDSTQYYTARNIEEPQKEPRNTSTPKSDTCPEFAPDENSDFYTANEQIDSENLQDSYKSNTIVIPPANSLHLDDEKNKEDIAASKPIESPAQSPELSITSGQSSSLLRASKMKKKDKKIVPKSALKNATLLSAGPPSDTAYDSKIQIKEEVASYDETTSTSFLQGPHIYEPDKSIKVEESQTPILKVSKSQSTQDIKELIPTDKETLFDVFEKKDATTCCECDNTKLDMATNSTMTSKLLFNNNSTSVNGLKQVESESTLKQKEVESKTESTLKQKEVESKTGISRFCPLRSRNFPTQTDTKPSAETKSITDKLICKDCRLRKKPASTIKPKDEKSMEFEQISELNKYSENETSFHTTSDVFKRSNVSFGRQNSSALPESFDNLEEKDLISRSAILDKPLPGYMEGLDKCIAELECMRYCLKQAARNKDSIHECIKVYPEGKGEYLRSTFPHFHTFINGIPVVIQITKNPGDKNNASGKYCDDRCAASTTDKGNMCCLESVPDTKQPLACRILGTISRTAQNKCSKNSGNSKGKPSAFKSGDHPNETNDYQPVKHSEKGNNSVSRRIKLVKKKPPLSSRKSNGDETRHSSANGNDYTNVTHVESSESIPYVAGKNSLPKIDNPDKICSSLQFDVRTMEVTFENSSLFHPDKIINEALKNTTVDQLLDSFRPAKCCRKSVLNGKPHSKMPYAASLRSLPLNVGDLEIIKKIMQSNVPVLFKTQTLFEHYINFQKNIMSSSNKDTLSTATPDHQVFQVCFFEIFKKDDEDKSKDQTQSRLSTSNVLHDLKILDFIKRIYNSEPIYDKVSKKRSQEGDIKEENEKKITVKKEKKQKHGDKKERSEKKLKRSKQHKYKKTETKSYYTSVESYLTSKSNFILNSATGSQISTKYTKSRNSSMYSFLLIPKSELNPYASSNDLSTSYAPSVNSLPFEDEFDMASTTSTQNLTQASSDDGDEWFLSPGNYAKTLDGIYELDGNGIIRQKDITLSEVINEESETDMSRKFTVLPSELRDFTENLRNLSTIYEADEKNAAKESDVNIYSHSSSNSQSLNQSKTINSKNNINNFRYKERSRIPISINSASSNVFRSANRRKSDGDKLSEISNASLQSSFSSSYSVQQQKKRNYELVDMSTSTQDIPKNLIAKVYPKVYGIKSNQLKTDIIGNKQSVELQRTLHGTNDLELPITFEIVQPLKKKQHNMSIETKVMSYDVKSSHGIYNTQLKTNLKCYRSENICTWPQLQKKNGTSNNKAFYVSVHGSHFNDLGKYTLPDLTPHFQILQQYPIQKTTPENREHLNERSNSLSIDNFLIGYVGGNTENKSVLRKSIICDKTISLKQKRKTKHMIPEVIDIKVSKNIKSTKLKHKFFKDGDRPGYVAVLSTPCSCPDITIFLPCCCGQSDNCNSSFDRKAQRYTMVPMMEKNELKKH